MEPATTFTRALTSAALACVSSACIMDTSTQPASESSARLPGAAEQAQLAGGPATFTVDLAEDTSDGCCVADGDSEGRCNLRAAVLAAQAHPSATIALQVDSHIALGQLAVVPPEGVRVDLTITADELRTIRGSQSSRLFSIGANASVSIQHVRIQDFVDVEGGAVLNRGALHISDSTFASNETRCSGVGVLTALATCGGGAIANTGDLTIGAHSRFENNAVTAEASTAAYTTASAAGGAILSSGSVRVVGSVLFKDNSATAWAHSGIHEGRPSGAYADSAGGAIYSAGSLTFESTVPSSCAFVANAVLATAKARPPFAQEATTSGGVIRSPGALRLPAGVCTFQHNIPPTGSDVDASRALSGPSVEAS
jgi:hypothetical protein